ncbi:AmmeMemoRadiSam system protein B [bacterium]|nr:AmmeMemoRadiSam system protein B [bacterium]
MGTLLKIIIAVMTATVMISCNSVSRLQDERQPVDTVGFAQYTWQVDSMLARIGRLQHERLAEASEPLEGTGSLRLAVSPHDDYSYVGYLYPALLQYVNSNVVILFGVGHKAKQFGLEDKIVFGSYRKWKSPGGDVNVSGLQETLMKKLPEDTFIVHDSLQGVEHSLEALVPFLEHYNPDVEIIPVIVPYMSFERMEYISGVLAKAIIETMDGTKLTWGRGWSAVISTDAVHYGNEDWGGSNYDRFGVDSAGYSQAVQYEEEIMNTMLAGELSPEKIRAFSSCTVREDDYRQYKWTWCGRYAVPLGLLTAYRISEMEQKPLAGIPVGYSTSIAGSPIPVSDLGMGLTAPAKLTHWVGYAAVGYR